MPWSLFRVYHGTPLDSLFLLVRMTWHQEEQPLVTPKGYELELVVLMRNASDPETRLSRALTQEGKDLEGDKSTARVTSSSPTGSEGRDRPPKKAKTNGSDHRLGVLGETAVAKPFH